LADKVKRNETWTLWRQKGLVVLLVRFNRLRCKPRRSRLRGVKQSEAQRESDGLFVKRKFGGRNYVSMLSDAQLQDLINGKLPR
jgi:hypothetical protein